MFDNKTNILIYSPNSFMCSTDKMLGDTNQTFAAVGVKVYIKVHFQETKGPKPPFLSDPRLDPNLEY